MRTGTERISTLAMTSNSLPSESWNARLRFKQRGILGYLIPMLLIAASSMAWGQTQLATKPQDDSAASVEELTEMLHRIDPYRKSTEVDGTIRVFGSSSMDALAHGWVAGFKKHHPQADVQIFGSGSEAAFERLVKEPAGIAMLSRPVKPSELDALRAKGLKNPVALTVAREALGVFVNARNPVSGISGEQLRDVFTLASVQAPTWSVFGAAAGELQSKPIRVLTRSETSGTHLYLKDFVFNAAEMRGGESKHDSNAQVLEAISADPLAIAICGLRSTGEQVKALQLLAGETVVPSTDHAVLMGQYPLTRPLSVVIDAGQQSLEATRSQELVRFALGRTGQTETIMVGFFPVDSPLLRAGLHQLDAAATR